MKVEPKDSLRKETDFLTGSQQYLCDACKLISDLNS